MWIRSQNKTILVNARKVFIKGQGKKEDKFRIVGAGCLGTYSTKEKALKVLDMIEEEIIETCRDYPKVFQMPQEDEV